MEIIAKEIDKNVAIDELQAVLGQFELVDCPLIHLFAKGVYIRQISMPAITINSKGEEVQTVIVSKIHNTCHPFIVTKGKVAVYNKADDFLGVIEAPYVDLTLPGTRRILHILEDCHWMTVHRLPYITGEENSWTYGEKERLLARIEGEIIEKRELQLENINKKEITE